MAKRSHAGQQEELIHCSTVYNISPESCTGGHCGFVRAGNIQGTFREHSPNIHRTFSEHCALSEHSVTLALMITRRCELLRGLAYMAAQVRPFAHT
jgi:hypothetical protein